MTPGVKIEKLCFLISVALVAFVSVELVSVGLEDAETAATGPDMATRVMYAAHRRALIEEARRRFSRRMALAGCLELIRLLLGCLPSSV